MAGSSKRLHAHVDNLTDAISLMNAEGQVFYTSASAAKVLGYEPEELLGRNGFDLFHPQDRDSSLRTLKRMLAEPQSATRMQARVRQKNGQWRWVESTASNLLNVPRVAAIIVVHREIHDHATDDEAMQHTAEELRRRNAELHAFAHTVAHDLREPLRTIAGCTGLLLRTAQLDDASQENARLVVDGVRRMSALLDNMLASATRSFNESLRSVNLECAAAQAMANLKEVVGSSGALITIHPLPAVQGIESDLIRVFQNLIGNAVKYRGAAPAEVHITAEQSGPDVVIRVRDNGIGIPKEQHRAVFGLFRRLHAQAVPGTGIGLAVCKNIVEGLGGAIWVESEPGSGSVFCFTVPAEHSESGMPRISAEVPGCSEPAQRLAPSATQRMTGTR